MSEEANIVTSARFDFGSNENTPTTLKVDSATYKMTEEEGAIKFSRTVAGIGGGAPTTEVLEGDKLNSALIKAFGNAENGGKLAPHALDKLETLATHYAAQDFTRGNAALTDAIEFVQKGAPFRRELLEYATLSEESAKVASKLKLMKMLVENDGVKKYAPATEFKAFTDAIGREGWAQTQKEVDAGKALAKELLGKTFSEDSETALKELNGILAKHHTDKIKVGEIAKLLPESVSEHLGTHGLGSVETAVGNFAKDVSRASAALQDFAERRVELTGRVKAASRPLVGSKKLLEEAQNELTELDKNVAKFVGENPAHGAAWKEVPEGIRETLNRSTEIKSAAATAARNVGSAASDAGKEGRGFFAKTFDFKYSRAWAEETAKKKNMSVAEVFEKMGAEGSTRWGKVAAGVAIVAGAVLAGTSMFGNRDKEKSYVEAENQRRAANGQGAGLAV